MSTGFPDADARGDFDRERRRRALRSITARLRMEPDDVSAMLPFEEVVAALGRVGETDLGVHVIPLDSIVGTVDRRAGQFDRAFRPTRTDMRGRWERIAAARRRGESMPPIDVYRIGELHFVRDGHHRVSVARALGDDEIEARVRDVHTQVGAGRELRLRDLPLKQHERVFWERVPLRAEARARIRLSDEWRWAQLANLVEAWGYRASHARERLLSRQEMAEAWYEEEYLPVVELLHAAEEEGAGGGAAGSGASTATGSGGASGASAAVRAGGRGTEAERYLRIAMLRFLLLHTHELTDDMVERLLGEAKAPGVEEDTMVHRLLKELD